MERKVIPTILGVVGGFVLLLGAGVAVLAGMVNGIVYAHAGPILAGLALGVIAGVLGCLGLVMAYYARGSPTDRVVGGVTLLVLGVLGFVFVGASPIALVGSILVLFAGVVYTLDGAIPRVSAGLRAITG